ncbi:MAG: transcription antitermination factor NusB, partial [Pseudomonadota bacterium]
MTARTRALAAQVVADVIRGSAMDGPLERARDSLTAPADRALLGALCFGAVRHFPANRAIVRSLLAKPSQKLKPLVEALLVVGIEQLEHMRVAPHAAVSETVAAARVLKLKNATGLTNALLRRFQREREDILAAIGERNEVRFNHPQWLLKTLRKDWPDDWQAMVEANNAPAPMWLRVNSLRVSRVDYAEQLTAAAESEVDTGTLAGTALSVSPALPVTSLPGFADGHVAVQDQSAQLAVELLTPPDDGARILDACAAPGGKTGHLCERFGSASIVAVDHSQARLARLRDNLQRMGHSADVRCGPGIHEVHAA